jgi:PEP-CTERM motif
MKLRFATLAGAAALVASGASHALTFNFTFVAGTSAQAQQAFIDAGNRWSALFNDNVTLDLTVGQTALNPGVLASAGSTRSTFSYTNFKNALTADQLTANDNLAVANLPAGSSVNMLINRTSDNPNGAGSATPYLDNNGSANNSTIRITNANAKALGLAPQLQTIGNCVGNCDASITFATAFTWDYDPSNGITPGAYDFVGIATHEIGHALGFISGVDILDINSTGTFFGSDQFTFVNSLDLFRFSAASIAAGGLGTIDWSANNTAKYFSLDKGTTVGAGFSLGRTWGDGQQASHWKDSLGLGIMDPTAGTGELLAISNNDRVALDVIGWNLAPIPEPSTYAMFGLGLLGLAWRRRAVRRD